MSFNTDKVAHGYLPTYLEIAASIGIRGHVCELGVYGGGSLTMWQTLFPMGLVVGVDYVEACVWPVGVKKIVTTQTSALLPVQLAAFSSDGYDLIVDDCSHNGKLTRQSWELLWPLVKPGGWYVIEDWFVGLPPWTTNDKLINGDPEMLTTAESFLRYFPDDGKTNSEHDMESATYKHGLIILRKFSNA